MRLSKKQIQIIKQVVGMLAGLQAQVTLFGSRVDDNKKGGDVDLLVSLKEEVEHPAELSAKISARLIRQFQGRKVDVLLSAPNLKRFPIHSIAEEQGILL